jgi:hypothetical protein
MTHTEAFKKALMLGIIATTTEQASKAIQLAQDFAKQLTEAEIEACKVETLADLEYLKTC